MNKTIVRISALLLVSLAGASLPAIPGFQNRPAYSDEKLATSARDKFLALTHGWAKEAVLKPSEKEAMERGRQWEGLMTTGLDDPLAKKILAAGEPSFAALDSYYPGKVLDRTVLGSYSDPQSAVRAESENEFVVWWNGAISAHLVDGRFRGLVRPIANNTNLLFRVGHDAEMFGKQGERYSRLSYQDGYLPIVKATYTHDGVRYEQTVLADNPAGETGGCDVAYVRFLMNNTSDTRRAAEIHEDIILIDGTKGTSRGRDLVNNAGEALLVHSDSGAKYDESSQRLSHRFELGPGQTASVYFKLPYLPSPSTKLLPASAADFDTAYGRVRTFWTELLGQGLKIHVPEVRINDVWRALLLQNFILADNRRFTYGAGLWYNASYFPVENGLGGNDFAFYGFDQYSHELLPLCMEMSLVAEKAGRKYQNRRGVALHHLFENYRLTRKLDVFHKYREDMFRVAEEIIADRRKTMVEEQGRKPLHWGLLPPDRPGADDLGGNYTMYVLAHNITSCQGLQDFAQFLIRTGIDKERGERFLREAQDFRKTILRTLEKSVIRSEKRPPFVPLETLYFKETPDYGPEPYDDLARGRVQGTYYHYWADMELGYHFFNAADPIARWITDYVEEMGGFVLGCTRARHRPETGYGWINNVYNSGYYNHLLRRGDIPRFLLGFYSRLAFGMSRHAYVASEGSPFIGYNTKEGGFVSAEYAFPNSAANSETLRMLRTMLVFEELRDNIETGDLYLAKAAPRPWFADGQKIELLDAPTFFGKLSYTIESQVSRNLINARVVPPSRDRFRNIVISIRHPQKQAIRRVRVNGADHTDFDPRDDSIRLAYGPKEYRVEVLYR